MLFRFLFELRAKLAWLDPLPTYPWHTGAPIAEYDRLRRSTVFPAGLLIAGTLGLSSTWASSHQALALGVSFLMWALGTTGFVIAYARYMSTWDELQQRIGLHASAIALVATTAILVVNAFASHAHLAHIPVMATMIVPAVAYWASVIAVRIRLGVLHAESSS